MLGLLYMLFFVAVYADEQECGLHEHYNSCGTDCPVTCANVNDPPEVCDDVCFRGCECDEGFYRQYGRFVGDCVPKEECPSQIGFVELIESPDPGQAASEPTPQDPSAGQEGPILKDAGPDTSKGTCSQPPKTGLCRGYYQKYFYNQTSGRCETFVYGGCGGNSNNFATEQDCEAACAKK